MSTSEGRPVVKIASSEDGAGMALSAAEGLAYVQILARGGDPKLVVVDGAGKETLKAALVSRFRSSHRYAARLFANFEIERRATTLIRTSEPPVGSGQSL